MIAKDFLNREKNIDYFSQSLDVRASFCGIDHKLVRKLHMVKQSFAMILHKGKVYWKVAMFKILARLNY